MRSILISCLASSCSVIHIQCFVHTRTVSYPEGASAVPLSTPSRMVTETLRETLCALSRARLLSIGARDIVFCVCRRKRVEGMTHAWHMSGPRLDIITRDTREIKPQVHSARVRSHIAFVLTRSVGVRCVRLVFVSCSVRVRFVFVVR